MNELKVTVTKFSTKKYIFVLETNTTLRQDQTQLRTSIVPDLPMIAAMASSYWSNGTIIHKQYSFMYFQIFHQGRQLQTHQHPLQMKDSVPAVQEEMHQL